jgi:uncharacterized protein (DUF58 family)
MELSTFAFWILFSLILFAIFIMVTISIFSQIQKKRLERRLEEVFFEVRELNLRVTIVETRLEERVPMMQVSHAPSLQLAAPSQAKKRGRPRKNAEE